MSLNEIFGVIFEDEHQCLTTNITEEVFNSVLLTRVPIELWYRFHFEEGRLTVANTTELKFNNVLTPVIPFKPSDLFLTQFDFIEIKNEYAIMKYSMQFDDQNEPILPEYFKEQCKMTIMGRRINTKMIISVPWNLMSELAQWYQTLFPIPEPVNYKDIILRMQLYLKSYQLKLVQYNMTRGIDYSVYGKEQRFKSLDRLFTPDKYGNYKSEYVI